MISFSQFVFDGLEEYFSKNKESINDEVCTLCRMFFVIGIWANKNKRSSLDYEMVKLAREIDEISYNEDVKIKGVSVNNTFYSATRYLLFKEAKLFKVDFKKCEETSNNLEEISEEISRHIS